MIFANAHPKCGTNLVKKILGALGLEFVHAQVYRVRQNGPLEIRKNNSGFLPSNILSFSNKYYIHAHMNYGHVDANDRMIYCFRDPRNALVSYAKWLAEREGLLLKDNLLVSILTTRKTVFGEWLSSIAQFNAYLSIKKDNVICVDFDNIIESATRLAIITRIAKFLDLPNKDEKTRLKFISQFLIGDGHKLNGNIVCQDQSTWSGNLSNWKKFPQWNDKVEKAYQKKLSEIIENGAEKHEKHN